MFSNVRHPRIFVVHGSMWHMYKLNQAPKIHYFLAIGVARVHLRHTRVGTIQYVYRSVSIPYSTLVSCMVSPSPNEDPVGTTKCPDSLLLRCIQADSNNQPFVPKTPENFNKYLLPQTCF